jgi:hypothetical protein
MIDKYQFGKIVIDDQAYTRDLLIVPDGVIPDWWREAGHRLALSDLEPILANPPEVLVVGTGRYGRMNVPSSTRRTLENEGIELVVEPTAPACETYNQFEADGRRVAAALHLTC